MKILGIDPGTSGALALYGEGHPPFVADIPVIKMPRAIINDAELAAIIRRLAPDHVFIEDVHAMRGWGITGIWSFGKALGTILGVLGALGVPRTMVRPRAWQLHHKIKANDGGPSRRRAIELCPAAAPGLSRAMDHNRAEALLIAIYGSQTLPRSSVNELDR